MKKTSIISLLVLGVFVLSACSGPTTNNWPGLTADGERAYLATGSLIYAVDLETGKEVWRYPEEPNAKLLFYANPILTPDGQLLIGSSGTTHSFVSINPETGKDNWAQPFSHARGAWVAAPLVLNETIYAPNTDGNIYVLDMNGTAIADPIEIGGALWSAPSTDGTLLYVTSLDHNLHIINLTTHEDVAIVDLGGALPGSATIAEDGVYIGSFASRIEFIQPNGEHEVLAETTNWVWGSPVLDGETLYYADLNGNLFSYDIASGTQNWNDVKADDPVVANLLVVGDQIYVTTEAGTFVAYDKDAKIVWQKEFDTDKNKAKIYTAPVFSNDLILVAPYQVEFALAAYDAEGKQAWTFTPEK